MGPEKNFAESPSPVEPESAEPLSVRERVARALDPGPSFWGGPGGDGAA